MNNPTPPQRQGIPCPSCACFIDLSIPDLLSKESHTCHACGLELRIQRAESLESMEALSQLQAAIENLEMVKQRVAGRLQA